MKRILIVEDQAEIREIIRMTLELDDYEIAEAEDGDSGLRMVASFKPELVLLDVMMPGSLDGFQVCQRIKADADRQATKVVMLTARGQAGDEALGQQAGASALLRKPFSPLLLLDTVRRLI